LKEEMSKEEEQLSILEKRRTCSKFIEAIALSICLTTPSMDLVTVFIVTAV